MSRPLRWALAIALTVVLFLVIAWHATKEELEAFGQILARFALPIVVAVGLVVVLVGCELPTLWTKEVTPHCERGVLDREAMTLTVWGCDDPRLEGRSFPWDGTIPEDGVWPIELHVKEGLR